MVRRKTTIEGPDQIDLHVGGRVRLLRTLAGWSQERLGKAIGCSYQQLQKYESGTNRLSASMLFRVAESLHVPINSLFKGIEGFDRHRSGVDWAAFDHVSVEAVREIQLIEDAATREALRTLIRSLGSRQGARSK
jgi:transcriptional regulator with XRE-family HTH domain